jgi:hypothetical protein
MTTFDEREAAFESRFVHEAEMEFMAQASRNKHVAYWAAALMGKTAEQAVRYAKDVIRADLEEHGSNDVVRKLQADLGDLADEATIKAKMAQYLEEARVRARAGEIKTVF